jgi:hypothetical protein
MATYRSLPIHSYRAHPHSIRASKSFAPTWSAFDCACPDLEQAASVADAPILHRPADDDGGFVVARKRISVQVGASAARSSARRSGSNDRECLRIPMYECAGGRCPGAPCDGICASVCSADYAQADQASGSDAVGIPGFHPFTAVAGLAVAGIFDRPGISGPLWIALVARPPARIVFGRMLK